ncbi:MAG TPA: hypothetical protein VLM89_05630, partial [Phycisphaerae bacterium]|nr:hypothetical protein [Phycisphaerae bacterium]
PICFLRMVQEALPPEQRPRLSASAGLTYAPSRPVQLAVLPSEPAGMARLVAGQDIAIHRVSQA